MSSVIQNIEHIEHGKEDEACSICGAKGEFYLDAAAEEGIHALKCTACELTGVRKGLVGTDITLLNKEDDVRGIASIIDFVPNFVAQEAKWENDDETAPCRGANELFMLLRNEIVWEQHVDRLSDGSLVSQPRWIGYQAEDPNHVYRYPNIVKVLEPVPFTQTVLRVKQQVEEYTGQSFNSAHFNLYRDGSDHISWHTDEDVELYGTEPCIASISLGSQRQFILRHMQGTSYTDNWRAAVHEQADESSKSPDNDNEGHSASGVGGKVKYQLGDGSLLIMRGSTQRHFEHCVLKEKGCADQRHEGDGTEGTSDGTNTQKATSDDLSRTPMRDGERINITFRQVCS